MTEKEINDIFNSIQRDVRSHRLVRAMDTLLTNAEQSMCWEISDRIKNLSRDYSYMLDYMAAGYPDPNRLGLYNNVSERTLALSDMLRRRMLAVKLPSLYYSTLRVAEDSGKTIPQLISDFNELCSASDNIFARLTGTAAENGQDRHQLESAANELFNVLWTAYPLSQSDVDSLRAFMIDEKSPAQWRSLFLSAIMLGELEFHDAARLHLIIDIYSSTADTRFRAQALVALLLCIYRHHERGIEKSLTDRIKLLRDTPHWRTDLRLAFIEFIRTRDTQRINRTMTDEIIPTMMNMRPELMKRFENFKFDAADPEAIEFNPEWEDALKASGLTDKIKQMSELQSEGADVFMSTFSHLKRFPFFHEPAGWFTPFDPESSRVLKALGGHESAAEAIDSLPFLCDSDKYSLALSLDMVPEAQRQMMFEQFDAQRAQFYESTSMANETADDDMRRHLRGYLQNLYRFLKLFRRKGEFYNPFDRGVNLLSVALLNEDFDHAETLRVIAEFFFKLGYWADAEEVFTLLSKIDENDSASIWQKIGYCRQSSANIPAAIEAYSKAEMLAPESRWLCKRLYACHRAMGNYDRALYYARRIADDKPSLNSTLSLGYALLEAGKTSEALGEFRRAEFIDESSTRPLRPIAWTLFLEGDFDASRRYYERIVKNDPSSGDLLNYGHLELAAGHLREAFTLYNKAIDAGLEREVFFKRMADDRNVLEKLGVTPSVVAMICDALSSERSPLPPYSA